MVNLRINASTPVAKMARATATITALTGPAGAALEDLSVVGGTDEVQLTAAGTVTVPLDTETAAGDPIIWEVTVGRIRRHLDLSDADDDATVDWGDTTYQVLEPPAPTDWVPVPGPPGVVTVVGTAADAGLVELDGDELTVDMPSAAQVGADPAGTATAAVAAEAGDRVAGDAATLAAAIAYVDATDRDTQWLDDRQVTGRLLEQWLTMPAGARSNGDIGDALAVGIEAGSDGTATRSALYALSLLTLGVSTVHAGSTAAQGAARLVSGSLMQAGSAATIDFRVRFPIGGSPGFNDYRVVLGNAAGDFRIGPHASDSGLLQVYASRFTGLGYTDTACAEISAIDFHQLRLVSLGALAYRWEIDGETVHEATVSDPGVQLPVRAGIWKLAGSTARTVEIARIAAVWG